MLAMRCSKNEKAFELLPSSKTGVTFNNKLTESDTFNVMEFDYIYNGGGVGVGDVNNDGLTDIYFAGNMVSGALYLNKGNFVFEDITLPANVQTSQWCTGVSMIDINQDGLLDIYISTLQPHEKKPAVPNILFLNKGVKEKGVPVFEEIAQAVGLADSSYATHAAFLDYDRDGDLDMYSLTNAIESYNRNEPVGQRHNGKGKSVDKLYRNEGTQTNGLPMFKDVSEEAGIQWEGWGLGVVVNDINQDGYPDIYVANDFLSNDHIYINQHNGTFSNDVATMLRHQEHNGMGVDMADINNDGLNDIVVMDMMPEDNLRQKAMFSNIGYDRFRLNKRMNYQDQYVRNVLQLNNGNGTFSDVGYMAGVYATDWSWSSLLADFDNDGYRDLLVTNGYVKDVTDLDFVAYRKDVTSFGTGEESLKKIMTEINNLKSVKKPNCLFKNNGDLTFSNLATQWGLDQPSFSNGAAYADFDNDGYLDLVMNNINDKAFVYRNNLAQKELADDKANNNFIRIKFVGNKGNTHGLGTKAWVYYNGKLIFAEHQLQRGFTSTVEDVEHFGLGKETIDSIKVMWPSGKMQTITKPTINTVVTFSEKNATTNYVLEKKVQTLFVDSHQKHNLFYKHEEQDFVDFKQGQALLPQKHSQSGPGIAVGDINGDGLEDFIVGGSSAQPAEIFYQQKNETFKSEHFITKDEEDTGLLLFDADNDNDLDLYCVSGGTEFGKVSDKYQDRFYRNNKGKFSLDTAALPRVESSGSCVVSCDYDHDGDLDLFVGGRISPVRYPEAPRSYVLNNNGTGSFTDVTVALSSELSNPGMVCSVLWTDYNNDGWPDLAMVGEWMSITFFKNEQGKKFTKQNIASLETTAGWWNSIAGGDFDNDGDIDYIAGNLGKNSLFKASPNEPVCIYANDFDKNGSLDPVLCRYIQGKEHPTHPRETLTEQIPPVKRKIQQYSVYGKATIQDLFQPEQLNGAMKLKSTQFSSVYIENKGNNTFNIKELPTAAQTAPIFGIVPTDIDEDGNLDVLLIGNSYATETLSGYYDAGIGTCLMGDGKGNFQSVKPTQSGFFVNGDAKALAEVKLKSNQSLFVATQNQDSLKAFNLSRQQKISSPKRAIITNRDAYAEVVFKNGKKRKQEIYTGSGYLSASSKDIILDNPHILEINVVTIDGKSRVIK